MSKQTDLLSDEQITGIESGHLWSFHGGIHPNENKQQSNQTPIEDAGIPPYLIIAIEHKGFIPELLVKIGDCVLKGQPLTKVYGAMVVQHASSSGTVTAIEKRSDLHPSGLPVLSVVIKTDGLDRTVKCEPITNVQDQQNPLLIDKIQQAGIVGLGGAGFPTHLKLNHPSGIKLLLINAAECEPYITADDRLIQEHADEIITGIDLLQHIMQPALTVIAIEDNKAEAIAALRLALGKTERVNNRKIIITVIPTIYPSGSEKQLIEIITGSQTPLGKHPTELGIVMHNIGTVFAIKEALINNKPLTARIVTLAGDAFPKPRNVKVKIGTPIQYLLDKYNYQEARPQKLIIGGPMMGFTINSSDASVTKTCNCILAPTLQELPQAPSEMPCIRCGECADVCPAGLLPQQLLWYSQSQDHKKLSEYHLSSCIECGACAFVCSSHIPLVEYYRISKAEINSAKQEEQKTEIARVRFEKKEARLIQAKLERQAKHKEAAEKRKLQLKEKNGGQDLIAAALARAKAKKTETVSPENSKKDAVAAAIARAKAKKETASKNSDTAKIDTRKDAVAAAVARAKAKKEALANKEPSADKELPDNSEIIKARKQRKEQARSDKQQKEQQQTKTADQTTIPPDDKKAKIAAAITRAKAKKAAAEKGS